MPACQPGNMLVGLFHPNKWAHEKLHCVLVLSPPVAMACTLVHSESLEKLLGITYFGLGKHGATILWAWQASGYKCKHNKRVNWLVTNTTHIAYSSIGNIYSYNSKQ